MLTSFGISAIILYQSHSHGALYQLLGTSCPHHHHYHSHFLPHGCMYLYLPLPTSPAYPMTTTNASFKSLPQAEMVFSVLSEIPKELCIPLPNNRNNNVRWKHVWEEHVVNNIEDLYEKSYVNQPRWQGYGNVLSIILS